MTIASFFKKIVLCGLSLILIGISIGLPVNAEANKDGEIGLVVSPAIMELNGNKGGTYEFTLKLENTSSQTAYELFPSVQQFGTNNNDGIPVLSPIKDTDATSGWVGFAQDSYTIPAGQSVNARFGITIPADAQAGSYYLAISYATKNPLPTSQIGIVLDQEISALLFITVNGGLTRTPVFDDFFSNVSVVDPFLDDFLLTYKISTEGNAYLKPQGSILVGNDSQKPDQIITLNPHDKIIIPGTKRTFNLLSKAKWHIPWISEVVQSDTISGDSTINEYERPVIKNEKFDALLMYPNSDGVLDQKQMTTHIIFFPWKTLLLIMALIFVIACGYVWFTRFSKYAKNTKVVS